MRVPQIARHLPYLRRFARALTGDQELGDAIVSRTITMLASRSPIAIDAHEERTLLYRELLDVMDHDRDHDDVAHAPQDTAADRRLGVLTPRARRAFLLVSVEGFSEPGAAEVLRIDIGSLRALIDEAGRDLAAEIATDVLVIEDEPFIAHDLKELIERLGHRVVGIARTHAEAVELAGRHRPGLVLADIQLADGSSGLDAVNEVLESFTVPIVFVTAYPERFLTGERPEPAFLVTKPFEPSTIAAIVSQVLFFERNAVRKSRRVA